MPEYCLQIITPKPSTAGQWITSSGPAEWRTSCSLYTPPSWLLYDNLQPHVYNQAGNCRIISIVILLSWLVNLRRIRTLNLNGNRRRTWNYPLIWLLKNYSYLSSELTLILGQFSSWEFGPCPEMIFKFLANI